MRWFAHTRCLSSTAAQLPQALFDRTDASLHKPGAGTKRTTSVLTAPATVGTSPGRPGLSGMRCIAQKPSPPTRPAHATSCCDTAIVWLVSSAARTCIRLMWDFKCNRTLWTSAPAQVHAGVVRGVVVYNKLNGELWWAHILQHRQPCLQL